jgi:hypothetical protein
MKIALIFVLFLSSCTTSFNKIESTDSYIIQYFNRGDTLTHADTGKNFIKSFGDVLMKDNASASGCDTSGRIFFFRSDTLIYQAFFSTEITSGLEGCEFLMDGKDVKRLTYQAGRYLDETFHKLRN